MSRCLALPKALRGLPVWIAVSGGLDSTVLAAVALRLRSRLPALHFAHVNYGLRVPDSDREEATLRDWAKREGVPIRVLRLRIGVKPANLQAWARERRLAFFRRLIAAHPGGRGLVWMAHHQRDQAETVLARLLRGAGLKGLRGMDELEQIDGLWVFRPFLGVPREALEVYAGAHRLNFHHDRSNDGDDYLRNRIRHRILPRMAEENPRVQETLTAFATRAGQAAAALEVLAQDWLRRAARGSATGPAALDPHSLRRLPAGLRAAVLEAWLRLRTGFEQSFGKILPPLLAGLEEAGKGFELPLKGGYWVKLTPQKLAMRRRSTRLRPAPGRRRRGRAV
ncbi:MAG: tRNA lysidine(34) synthetase TilS [Deltaproteobacteria bacterium]|nr:tRNA lysidine(34) synthetase TilS [Deltaproteobacteria bacterium]